MSYTKTDFQTFLAFQPPFDRLPTSACEELAGKFQPLRYRMGQPILVRERVPTQVALLYEGEMRLLGYDTQTQMPISLKIEQPGALVGWVGLLRGVPCETAIASRESICLTLNARDFLAFCQRYPELKEALESQCALIEAFDLLGKELERQPQGGIDLKTLAEIASQDSHVCQLPPGTREISRLSADHPLLDPERIWLVSGGQIEKFPIGSRLQLSETNVLQVKGDRPARLVGFRIEELPWLNGRAALPSADNGAIPELPDADGNGNVAIADASEATEAPDEVPYAEPVPTDDTPQPSDRANLAVRGKYPWARPRGRSAADYALACFQMLSQYFQIPFRREVIRRVINDQIQRSGAISLPVAGAIAELMGLKAQLANLPAKNLPRIETPALIRWHDQLAILYEVSDRGVVLGVPEKGIVRRKLEEFTEVWGKGGQILLLQETKETPKERFGLQWFLPALIRYRGTLLLVFAASFFVQLFGLANPLMIQVIIDKVIVQNSPDTLHVLGIFLVVIAVFEALLSSLRTYIFVDATNRIDMTLGSQIIDHLLRLPLRYFEKRPVGELSSRVNELERIRQFLTGTALTVVLDSIFSVLYIVVLFLYSWQLTIAALATIPLFIFLTLIFSPTIRRQLRTKAERNAETQSHLVEVMNGIQTVKAQNIELRARWKWQSRYARYVAAGFKNVTTSTIAGSASNFLNKFSGLMVLWFGAYLVLQGELTLGQLIAFRIIAGMVTQPLLRLAQSWQSFQEVALSLERLSDIIDTPQEDEQDRENIPMPAIAGSVKYENVCFRFKNQGPLQLNGVNIDIPAGTFVGVVGQSGAGKSTLTKLLARLYESESGRILVDNYDISKVELYSLRRQIGVVPQETLLFDGTVQENIGLTNPDATTEEIIEAAQAAAAHEFIMNLPSGYNTRVGERGAALSGGQRQRIAIARTILQQPRLLVLDEATSALDYATEQQVCRNLNEVFRGRTVFFITHRLATIKIADTILMMDAGRVVEQGNHSELMAMRGRYYYLYQQQESQL